MKDQIIQMAPSKCKVCPRCGAENPEDRSHCRTCDSPMGSRSSSPVPDSDSSVTQAFSIASPENTLAPGSVLAQRYLIERNLGQGGMASVFKATDLETGEAIAIKFVRPELAGSGSSLSRFKRELVMTHAITHPNVVRTYALVTHGTLKFITMAFVEGEDLDALRSHSRLSVVEVVRMICQVCDGLAAAHERGIVHRDLKPENIMVQPDGHVLVMDFGLAQSAVLPDVTQAGTFLGTPDYCSPEQVRGLDVDPRADIFSLGVIFYELLTGALPFARALNPAAMAERCTKRPQAPSQLNSQIPDRLDRVVLKCLECDPDSRYASIAELKRDLLQFTGSCAPAKHSLGVSRRTVLAAASATTVLGCVAAAAVWISHSSGTREPVAMRPVRVLVADLTNETGDKVFDGALEPLITIALEASRNVTCYDRAATHKLAESLQPGSHRLDAGTARLAAIREGLDVVVDGSVRNDGGRYTLQLEAVNAGDGRVLASGRTTAGDRQSLLARIDRTVTPIRRALGDGSAISTQLAKETFTANSLESAHLYAMAQEHQLAGKYEEALREYLAVTQLDPSLGRAWAGAATMNLNLGYRAEADRLFRKALSNTGRMTDREKFRTRGAYYIAAGDYSNAIEEYSQLVQEYPFDNAGHANLALAFFYKLDFNRAVEEGRKAVDIYPKNVAQRNNLAWYALYAGDFAQAEREAREVALNNDFEKGWVALALAEIAQGRRDDAIAAWNRLREVSARGASLAALGTADLALMEARPEDAISILQPAAETDISNRRMIEAGVKHTLMAEARLLQGNQAEAEAEATRALAFSRDRLVAFPAARVYINTGRADKVRPILDELRSTPALEAQIQARLIEGEMHLKEGRAVKAIALFEEAKNTGDSWLGRLDLARAYIENRQFAQADSEIDLCIRRRGEALAAFLDDRPTLRYLAPVYYYRGRAEQGLGSTAAVDSYNAFLAIKTGTADPLIGDVRKRLHEPSSR